MSMGTHDSNRKPAGSAQITLTSTTAQNLPVPVPSNARVAMLSAEVQGVRYRDDGIADPTATVGFPLPVALPFLYTGDIRAIRLIGQTTGAILNIAFYE